ncbi:hypothetical protein KCU67_g10685, partial [Aureobasidium melanogenum]
MVTEPICQCHNLNNTIRDEMVGVRQSQRKVGGWAFGWASAALQPCSCIGVLASGDSAYTSRMSTAYHVLINILRQQYTVSFMLPDEFGKLDLVGFDYYNSSQWRQVYSKQYLENNGDLVICVDKFAFPVSVDPESHTVNWINDTSTSISDSLDSMMNWVTVPASINLSGIFNISQLQLPNATQFDPSNNISVLQTLGISLNKDNWLEDYKKYSIHLGPALSRQTIDGSNVQLAVPFMVVVLICNLTKMTVMFLVLFNDHEEHLVTNGDALANLIKPLLGTVWRLKDL